MKDPFAIYLPLISASEERQGETKNAGARARVCVCIRLIFSLTCAFRVTPSLSFVYGDETISNRIRES